LGEVHYVPFWYFDGHIDESNSGGKGEWSYEAWTQGEFSLCIGNDIGCLLSLYPWIDITVLGNGDYSYDADLLHLE